MIRKRDILLAATLSVVRLPVPAAQASKPILSLHGNLSRFTDAERRVYEFSEAEFFALRQTSITTATAWTPLGRFDGPLLADVLDHVGAKGARLNVHALDNYSAPVPRADLATYGVILAHSLNGRRLAARDFGPLWVMYPRDRHPNQLNKAQAQAKFVWQVGRIDVGG